MKGFKNANAYISGKGIQKVDIAIQDGKIVDIGKNLSIDEEICCNGLLCPGFIDRHVHGANGSDAMDCQVLALQNIAKNLVKEGTTTFLATTMTNSVEDIKNSLTAVKNYKRDGGAILEGVHLEGPFISPKHIGAQPLEHVLSASVDIMQEFIDCSANKVKLVTLAPEQKGALELIEFLTKQGIKASVGHSNASFIDVQNAISCGLNSITHTYNAQSGLHHREVGVVGSAMLLDEVFAEIICDFIHVSKPAVELLLKNKPKDKIILITDSMRAKYLPDGESELGGQKVIVKNGEARLTNGTLAGSVLKMNDAIKNLVNSNLASLEDAIVFATENPAKSLGIFDSVGSISVGKSANFTVLDNNFNVLKTIVQGETEYTI